MEDMQGNVLGPALVAKAFLSLLERPASDVPSGSPGRPPVVLNMSSGLGSIGLKYGAKNAIYSISKTALNMLVSFVPFIVLQEVNMCTCFTDIQTSGREA
jgi:NAD(P)-dependent dehydrogenase (short-subunit alcohol dehydrogenase family)